MMDQGWSPSAWGCPKCECRACKTTAISYSILIGFVDTDVVMLGEVDMVIRLNLKLPRFLQCKNNKNVHVQKKVRF